MVLDKLEKITVFLPISRIGQRKNATRVVRTAPCFAPARPATVTVPLRAEIGGNN
jgi:hypothetical protein